tara:strand:+ start:3011 stop:4042 length:1032 start_codon:yes stop_codon:yes gene_type:complete
MRDAMAVYEKGVRSASGRLKPDEFFASLRVAIIPFPALGDLTIYLRLAWSFHHAGAQVTFCSSVLLSAKDYFPWLIVIPDGESALGEVASDYDLVIACFEKCYRMDAWRAEYGELPNTAFVTAKKIARESGLDGRDVLVRGRQFPSASRAFCLDSKSGQTMVDWVDSYAKTVFHLDAGPKGQMLSHEVQGSQGDLVLIFPTTPQAKKNYWLGGFRLLATALRRRGWRVEFVCMPSEHQALAARLPGFLVHSFPDIRCLMEFVAGAATVISNDSGGGHLASMMGIPTFTITRRRKQFVWRPGFNKDNTVLYPLMRFKWLRKQYVWRPFVPIWRIASQLGSRSQV